MVWRVLRFLAGAGIAGGGGYLVWTHRGEANALYPFVFATAPWLLIAGLGLLVVGMVTLVSSLLPSHSAEKRAEKSARQEAHLKDADAFYAERARTIDRDWRSGDLPPEPAPRAGPAPVQPEAPPHQPEPVASISPSAALPPAEPARPAVQSAPERPPQPAAPVRPIAAPAVAVRADRVFATAATLAPIPRAASFLSEPLPPHLPVAPAPAAVAPIAPDVSAAQAHVSAPAPVAPEPAPVMVAAPANPMDAIRTAIAASRLDEADRMLSEQRTRLTAEGADSLALAELTGLAGDHAAAAGRLGGAKWLWRLSLQRFAAANAIATPAARNVSERLRLADQ